MAIDISTETPDVAFDYYCIGMDRTLEWEVDFGTAPTGKLVNFNFHLWGNNPGQMSLLPGPSSQQPLGYSFIAPSSTTYGIEPAFNGPDTWQNFKVKVDYFSSGLANVYLSFLHTMDMRSWITTDARDNNSRLWRSRWNDATEFTITPLTIYDSFIGNLFYSGIRVSTYDVSGETYTMDETAFKDDARNDCYFWNPVSPTDPMTEWPFVGIKSYKFELSRNSIPVTTLSSVQDTKVKLKLEQHPALSTDPGCDTDYFGDLFEYYWVGLARLEEGANNDTYWNDLPVYFGYMSGTNWSQTNDLFPQWEKPGIDMIANFTGCTEVTPQNWELEFDLKKEFVQPGFQYRLYVVVRNDYCFNV